MNRRVRRQLLEEKATEDVAESGNVADTERAKVEVESDAKKMVKSVSEPEPVITLFDATFVHIDAGVLGTYSGVDISKDVDSNMAASSCAIYCEDSCDGIEFEDISEECMNGHMYCNELKQMITEIECNLDADYNTPIGTIYVKHDGNVEADLFRRPGSDRYAPFLFKGQWFALGIILLLGVFFSCKCLLHSRKMKMKHRKRKRDLDLAARAVDGDYGSLGALTDNDLIDYDALGY